MSLVLRRLLASLLVPVALCAACGHARVVQVDQPGEYGSAPSGTAAKPVPAARKPPPPKPAIQALPADKIHLVQAGETLYGISFRYGLRYQDVAGWNGIGEPYAIRVGQRLRLQAPAGATTAIATSTSPASPSPFETVPAAAPAAVSPAATTRPVPTSPVAAAAAPPASAQAPAPAASSPMATSAQGATTIDAPKPAAAPMPADGKPVAVPGTGASVAAPPVASTPAVVNPSVPIPAPPLATAGNGALAWRWPTQGQIIGRYVSGDQTQQGINIAGKSGQPVAAAADGVVVYSGAGLVGYGELIIIKHSNEWLSAYAHNRRRLVAEGAKVKAGDVIAEMGSTGAIRDMLHFEIRRNGKPVDPLSYLPPR